MEAVAIKRRTVHLDNQDMDTLTRLAQKLSEETGLRVTASGLLRQAIKEFLRSRSAEPRRRK